VKHQKRPLGGSIAHCCSPSAPCSAFWKTLQDLPQLQQHLYSGAARRIWLYSSRSPSSAALSAPAASHPCSKCNPVPHGGVHSLIALQTWLAKSYTSPFLRPLLSSRDTAARDRSSHRRLAPRAFLVAASDLTASRQRAASIGVVSARRALIHRRAPRRLLSHHRYHGRHATESVRHTHLAKSHCHTGYACKSRHMCEYSWLSIGGVMQACCVQRSMPGRLAC